MKVLELQAEGEKKARLLRGEGEAAALAAIDEVAINPNTLAVLQLRALQDVAAAPNAKVVVPYSAAGLVGNAEVLRAGTAGRGRCGQRCADRLERFALHRCRLTLDQAQVRPLSGAKCATIVLTHDTNSAGRHLWLPASEA